MLDLYIGLTKALKIVIKLFLFHLISVVSSNYVKRPLTKELV
jgi:hypothetical protein